MRRKISKEEKALDEAEIKNLYKQIEIIWDDRKPVDLKNKRKVQKLLTDIFKIAKRRYSTEEYRKWLEANKDRISKFVGRF